MKTLREQCFDLLVNIPDDDLQQVLDGLQEIIDYNAEADNYIPHGQSVVISIPAAVGGIYTVKGRWVWDDKDGWVIQREEVPVCNPD